MDDLIRQWRERVREAAASGRALCLRGGGTKRFLGRPEQGELLDTRDCSGIVNYEPSELVVTVRAGTPLAELEAELATRGQMLAFEPPHFGPGATVGGCVAAGLAGPRRAAVGGVRDFILGARLIDGRGELLRFGGEVMKNVAGYDVSRVLAGSLGTLGLIVDLSLKVLPRPVAEASLRFEMDEAAALHRLNVWGGQPLPISASAWQDGILELRLSGAAAAVDAAMARLGGERVPDAVAEARWHGLREQTAAFFTAAGLPGPLWRLSLPSDALAIELGGAQLVEWGGAQRWLRSDLPPGEIRGRVGALGGHASLFRNGVRDGEVFHPLTAPMQALQRNLKNAFDPAGVFNPGRLYEGF
ncbi:glycolate oxidase subunit GlcE [Zoogloea sp.]|uniref:glycolate oxidase subunit GlcE n=1 Tax=Zoogloea sp. TaxID=49181 RepID=UPI0025CC3DAB|nr:glycolate oxidase subunit GlcE [Zoogloea sp.]MCK6392323.1 glycolate oxidase subunit GlcE [Zoogloea sp.]